MLMEEPRISFVALQLDDTIVTSDDPGSSIAICQRTGDNRFDCTGTGAMFNYYSLEDCGGDLEEFDY